MEKEFVNYNQALKLKEFGFDEPCFGFYHGDDFGYKMPHERTPGTLNAPTRSQAFRWFREKHNIHSWVKPLIDEVGFVYEYQARIHEEECSVEIIGDFYKIEEAERACLDKLIEIVESKSE